MTPQFILNNTNNKCCSLKCKLTSISILMFSLAVIANFMMVRESLIKYTVITSFDNTVNNDNRSEETPIDGVSATTSRAKAVINQMKAALDSIKSSSSNKQPRWPQLDYRTHEAISEGVVLMPEDDNYNSKYETTIVTAYYAFESKHSIEQYKTWMARLLQASDPMIIFVEPGSEYFEYFVEARAGKLTVVVPHSFQDNVMSSTFTEEFWQEQHKIDKEASIHKGTGVYKIWNEKFVFLNAAWEINPFRTETFTWMDMGYFRNAKDAVGKNEQIMKMNLALTGVPTSKVLFLHVRDPKDRMGNVLVAGNTYTGTIEALSNYYTVYYRTFWDMVLQGKFVGSDQHVMAETCYWYSEYCHLFFPGSYKRWFAMIQQYKSARPLLAYQSPKFEYSKEPPSQKNEPPQRTITTMYGYS